MYVALSARAPFLDISISVNDKFEDNIEAIDNITRCNI
jgi:hypothetical protein